jgi:lipopolysaccharide biosynthesis glycosyltransferase
LDSLKVFVGFDPRETVAYWTFCSSVQKRCSLPVSFQAVRGARRDGSNDFIYERFRVAEMCGFRGWCVFADGDMICRTDLAELMEYANPWYDLLVVKHDYQTKYPIKYLGQKNEDYPRKNWSSLMLINCTAASWQRMTKERIDKMSGSELHQFKFLNDSRIGELPKEWNWLVGEYPYNPEAKIAHFTVGTPCWESYSTWAYSEEWRKERDSMLEFECAPAS